MKLVIKEAKEALLLFVHSLALKGYAGFLFIACTDQRLFLRASAQSDVFF